MNLRYNRILSIIKHKPTYKKSRLIREFLGNLWYNKLYFKVMLTSEKNHFHWVNKLLNEILWMVRRLLTPQNTYIQLYTIHKRQAWMLCGEKLAVKRETETVLKCQRLINKQKRKWTDIIQANPCLQLILSRDFEEKLDDMNNNIRAEKIATFLLLESMFCLSIKY